MEFRYIGFISSLFCIAVLVSHAQASLPAENYWRSLWPNSPMPKDLKDLMQPAAGMVKSKENKYTWYSNPITDNKNYKKGAASPNTEHKDELNMTFFFEHDLHPGKIMNLGFTRRTDELTFLPEKVANSIPFSSTKFPEILNLFSIKQNSTEAEKLKETLELCEIPALKGEDKLCATSLESMLNFAVSELGKNIKVHSTVFENKIQKLVQYQEYSVVEGVHKAGEKAVVCHKLNYPYAVFYCHTDSARAYTVPLVATDDGKKAKGLVVCHTNTAQWNPKHVALQQLNVKPGTLPICHFLDTNTLFWVPN